MSRPPRPARSPSGAAPLWIGCLLVATLGVLFAVFDATGGDGATAAPDGSFGGMPDASLTPDLVRPLGPPTPKSLAPPAPVQRAGDAARGHQADALIQRLLKKIRAERRAKAEARAERRGARNRDK